MRFCHKCPMYSQKHPLAVSKYTSRVKENTTQSKQKIYKCSSSSRRIPRFRFDNMFLSMMFFYRFLKYLDVIIEYYAFKEKVFF